MSQSNTQGRRRGGQRSRERVRAERAAAPQQTPVRQVLWVVSTNL